MEVGGTAFYEKKEVGAALLAVCQSMKQARLSELDACPLGLLPAGIKWYAREWK